MGIPWSIDASSWFIYYAYYGFLFLILVGNGYGNFVAVTSYIMRMIFCAIPSVRRYEYEYFFFSKHLESIFLLT